MKIVPRNEYKIRFIPNHLPYCVKSFVRNQGMIRATLFSIYVEKDKLNPEHEGLVFAHPFNNEQKDFIFKHIQTFNGKKAFCFKTRGRKTDKGEFSEIVKTSRKWIDDDFEMNEKLFKQSCNAIKKFVKTFSLTNY